MAVMKILVVEDEVKTAAYLKRGLEENGFVIDLAGNGQDGIHLAETGFYDLVILDVMLPIYDGWSVVIELRRRKVLTPVLFLTARDAVHDRVKGLEIGADDYLVKPFAFSELLARIRLILRRGASRQAVVLAVADRAPSCHPWRQASRPDAKRIPDAFLADEANGRCPVANAHRRTSVGH